MKYYVTADTHGYLTKFLDALKSAGYYDDPSEKKIIICGDLFDRGTEAKELQQWVLDNRDQLILVRGNHEDLYVELVTTDEGKAYSHHVHNGTYQTALALTGFDPVMASIRHFDFAEAGQRTPFYKEIIPSMLDYYETPHYVFVHGWIPCRSDRNGYRFEKITAWRDCTPDMWAFSRWINGMEAAHKGVTEDGKTIVCGHWHTSYGYSHYKHSGSEFGDDAVFDPYFAPGIIALDACTAHSGKVNILMLED